ncbi:MAG: hypothetical protein ACW99J_15995, partial [Candidatus Thorarchaeota archaeon]
MELLEGGTSRERTRRELDESEKYDDLEERARRAIERADEREEKGLESGEDIDERYRRAVEKADDRAERAHENGEDLEERYERVRSRLREMEEHEGSTDGSGETEEEGV